MLWTRLTGSFTETSGSGLQFVGGKAETISATQTPSFSLTNLTGGLASAPAVGDIVIACVAFNNSTNRNIECTTSDYTEVADLYANSTIDCQFGVYYKVLANADTNIAFNLGTSVRPFFAAHVWRGGDSSSPLDATTTTITSTGFADPPAITTVSSNAVIIAVGALVGDGMIDAIEAPDDVEMENFYQSTINVPTTGAGIAIVSRYLASAGTYNPPRFRGYTVGSGSGTCAATIALRPA